MKISRVRGAGGFGRAALGLACLALVLVQTPAHSQAVDSTIKTEQESPSPTPPAVPPAGPPADLRAVQGRPGAHDALVEVGRLGVPDTSRVGLMGQAEGGLSPSMWAGTSFTRAAELLKTDPRATASRALQQLGRRLLLSEAVPPAGRPAGSPSFLTLRLERLLALGDFDSVKQLSNVVPPAAKTEGELRVRADAFLLDGDNASACQIARRMRQIVSDPHWAKLGAFCDVEAGDIPAAELSINLLKAQGDDDPSFYALYDWLVIPGGAAPGPAKASKKKSKAAKAAPPVPPQGDGSPLSFAMLRAAKLPLPETATWGRLALLNALAREGAGDEVRLAAATEAAGFGAYPLAKLRTLYEGRSVTPEALADPVTAASTLSPPQALALFYQSVTAPALPAERAARVSKTYLATAIRGQNVLLARLILPNLQALVADPSLTFAAPDLIEAFLAADDAENGYLWYDLIDARGRNDEADPRRADHLGNLLRIAAPSERLVWTPRIVRRQLDRAALAGSAVLAERGFEVRILAALGYEVDPDVLAALPPIPPVLGMVLPAFQEAVGGQRVAEAILLACQAFGAGGPAAAPRGLTLEIVRGLNALGLEDDARAIGLEAALAPAASRS